MVFGEKTYAKSISFRELLIMFREHDLTIMLPVVCAVRIRDYPAGVLAATFAVQECQNCHSLHP